MLSKFLRVYSPSHGISFAYKFSFALKKMNLSVKLVC